MKKKKKSRRYGRKSTINEEMFIRSDRKGEKNAKENRMREDRHETRG